MAGQLKCSARLLRAPSAQTAEALRYLILRFIFFCISGLGIAEDAGCQGLDRTPCGPGTSRRLALGQSLPPLLTARRRSIGPPGGVMPSSLDGLIRSRAEQRALHGVVAAHTFRSFAVADVPDRVGCPQRLRRRLPPVESECRRRSAFQELAVGDAIQGDAVAARSCNFPSRRAPNDQA